MPHSDPVARREYRRARYAKHKDRIREYENALHKAHPERARKYYLAWRKRNPTALADYYQVNKAARLQQVREYAKRHPDRVRAYKSAWEKRNPAWAAEKQRRRYATKRQACPAWADKAAIAAIYAKAAAEGMHVDHVVPLTSQVVCGLHVEHNLQLLPSLENTKKGNRFWPDMP